MIHNMHLHIEYWPCKTSEPRAMLYAFIYSSQAILLSGVVLMSYKCRTESVYAT